MKRKTLFSIGALALIVGGSFYLKSFSVPPYDGDKSDHFDGERFHNPGGLNHGFFALVKWVTNRERGYWPDWTESTPGAPPVERVAAGELRVTWVNHATLLVQLDGVNILTDPVWSYRVSPVSVAGPRRHRDPGIRFEDLPPIDIVAISHNHYDNMNIETIRRLVEEHDPVIFCGLGNAAFLEKQGIDGARDLDWWDNESLEGITVTAVPARHFSARGPGDRDRALWAGYVFRGQSGSAYFAGDTGYGRHFSEIGRRLGPIDVALLPIGAFRPRWFMSPVHIDPQQAVQAHKDLGAAVSIPMHYGTFPLGDDGETEAIELLREVVAADPDSPAFTELENGGSWVRTTGEKLMQFDEPATNQ